VETGENAAAHALGTDVWEYRRLHPEHGEVFDATMRTLSAGTPVCSPHTTSGGIG
jgi:hypothetical protein